jgi:hypothetical protein
MDKPKRDLKSKESFLEGNRQRWLVVFLICAAIIFAFDAAGKISKVDSYLTFLTFLSGAFILGYSGTETMKLFSVSSQTQNINQQSDSKQTVSNQTKSESKQVIINEVLTHNTKESDYKL